MYEKKAPKTAIQAKVTKRDALQRQYDDVIKERDKLKTSEERQFGLLSNLGKNRVEDRLKATADHNVYESRAYEMAWANYIKTGNDAEARDLINTQDRSSTWLTKKVKLHPKNKSFPPW